MNASAQPPRIHRRALLATAVAAALCGCAGASLAVGRSVNVDVIDRDTGQVLEVYHHRGRQYVAGQPGARYAIRISNRSGGRVLAVTAVDGVNIVSGQTAAWGQTGYVFEPGQSYDLTGWRKSDQQVAAFAFTSLPDSYAARTGRPLDVGVIGVAVFRERPQPVVITPPWGGLEPRERDSRAAGSGTAAPRAMEAPAPAAPAAQAQSEKSAVDRADLSRGRLGTAHGEREYSQVSHTSFERASSTPDEIVSIQYDRYENLVAAGIIAPRRWERPRPLPFPGSHDPAYVPDPPLY
jgi:hypothetical protein